MSALARVAGKSLEANLLQKWFYDRVFYITIADADIKSLKSLQKIP